MSSQQLVDFVREQLHLVSPSLSPFSNEMVMYLTQLRSSCHTCVPKLWLLMIFFNALLSTLTDKNCAVYACSSLGALLKDATE